MPRQARLDEPGALHHIIVRGINRGKIFKDDKDNKDKEKLIERLGEKTVEGKSSVYAWVLMDNQKKQGKTREKQGVAPRHTARRVNPPHG